jgi:tRNA(Ile)-lysidine synthase
LTYHPLSPAEFVDRLAAAWPAEQWRDVHVAVAVSGGADSMALLRGLLELRERDGGAGGVHAAHVNHQLRPEADADEAWLQAECAKLGVPLSVERMDVAALAAVRGDGVEAAAREARYQGLTSMAEGVGARFVALGHTRDDQVETILFRVLRGTGLRGLGGIPATRRMSASVMGVRPLLGLSHEDVLGYLEAIGQAHREDASNVENRFTRNRVRHELLPLLRDEYNHEVDAAIVRLGTMASDAQAVIEELAEELLARCRNIGAQRHVVSGERGIVLNTAPLGAARRIVAIEALRRAWREAGFGEQGMTRQWWGRLAQFAQSEAASDALNLPGNVHATRPEPGLLALRAGGLS